MTDLDEFALSRLAREMAMNIRPIAKIFEDFGIDETQFYEISKNPVFIKTRDQFALEWNSSLSATERVNHISAAYLEQILPVVGGKALDRSENLAAATDVAKFLARNAGIGEPRTDGAKGAAERFVITINLGADTEKYDKSLTIDANDAGVAGAVPAAAALPDTVPKTMSPAKPPDPSRSSPATPSTTPMELALASFMLMPED